MDRVDHWRSMCYIAYDPQEDTETGNENMQSSPPSSVTSPTIRKRILKRRRDRISSDEEERLHRLRSARGY